MDDTRIRTPLNISVREKGVDMFIWYVFTFSFMQIY